MKPQRKADLRKSLERQLDHLFPGGASDPPARVRWLAEQLENYVERWLAFATIPAMQSPALLQDDLFAMIEIGTETMSAKLASISDVPETTRTWERFTEELAAVRNSFPKTDATRLRTAFQAFARALRV